MDLTGLVPPISCTLSGYADLEALAESTVKALLEVLGYLSVL